MRITWYRNMVPRVPWVIKRVSREGIDPMRLFDMYFNVKGIGYYLIVILAHVIIILQ
jgi:hypothetical protein